MATFTWVGTIDGDISNYLNYLELSVPNSGDEVTVDSSTSGYTTDPAFGSAGGNWTFTSTFSSLSGFSLDNGNATIGSSVMFVGCSFPAYFIVSNYGSISGGAFNGTVNNYSILSGGTYLGNVITITDITGGDFYGSITFNTTSSALSGSTLESGSSVIADGVTVTNSYGNIGYGCSFSVANGGAFSGFQCTWLGNSDQNLNNAANWDFCCLFTGNTALVSDAITSTYTPGSGTCNALLSIISGSQGVSGGTYSDVKSGKDLNGITITNTLISDGIASISLSMCTLNGATVTSDTTVMTIALNNYYVGTTFSTVNGGTFIGTPGDATWTGATDTNLNDITNWNGNYPCATVGVLATIPASLTNYPDNGTAACDFLIESGGQISSKVGTNYFPTINGNIENHGTIIYTYLGSSLIPSGTFNGTTHNYGSIDTGNFNVMVVHNGSTLTDSGPSSPNAAQALFMNQLIVANDISEIATSVILTGITALKVADSIVFTKGKGINGSGILGMI